MKKKCGAYGLYGRKAWTQSLSDEEEVSMVFMDAKPQ